MLVSPDPPGIPRNLKASDVTKKSCKLTWDVPEFDGGSPITGYYVEKLSGTRWIKVNKKAIDKCEMDIKDLIEGSDCEYRVLAENAAGIGEPSDSTGRFVAKEPHTAPGRPEAPKVNEITAETAQVSWKAPSSDGGAPISNYILEMKGESDVKWKMVSREITDTQHTVSGLVEGTAYEFRVAAQNKGGVGQTSHSSKPAKYGKFFHPAFEILSKYIKI